MEKVHCKVIIKGAGDPASGVAHRLWQSGFDVILLGCRPFKPLKQIGDLARQGETVATVNGVPLVAGLSGLIRGMLYPGLELKEGMKIGDIDLRGKEVDFRTISDKARAVDRGVLEAILYLM